MSRRIKSGESRQDDAAIFSLRKQGNPDLKSGRTLALALIFTAAWAGPERTIAAPDTPEDQQAHVRENGMPAPAAGATEGEGEKKADEMSLPSRQEGREELPAEFEPDQVIPFDQSRLGLPGWQEAERLPLPRRQHPSNQGGGLFPPEIWPLQPGLPGDAVLSSSAHRGGVGALETPAGALPTGLLDEKLTDLYFARRPDRVFLDPQHLLPPEVSEEMEARVRRWLNTGGPFHTTVLLFGPGQRLPPSVDAEAILRQWAGSGPPPSNQLLVFYYLREPARTKAVFAAGTAARFPEARLTEAMTSAIRAAGRAEGGLAQLERFCYKTTVHLHRLVETQPAGGELRARKPVWIRRRLPVFAGIGLGVVAVFWGLLRKRRHSGKGEKALPAPVLLPGEDFHTRLSAPHSGGLAAVITFPPPNHGQAIPAGRSVGGKA